MAEDELGRGHGMLPGFMTTDMANGHHLNSSSTYPFTMNEELDESQGNAAASSRPGEIQGYLQEFDSSWSQRPLELFSRWDNRTAHFAPSLLDPQDQAVDYVPQHAYEPGSQSMDTTGQPTGAFNMASLFANDQLSQYDYTDTNLANNPQGGTHDPGISFHSSHRGFDPPMMVVDPAGVPSQVVYPTAQGMPGGPSPNPTNPHIHQHGQYTQGQSQEGQYQPSQQNHDQESQYQQGQHQQDQCQQAQYQQYQEDQGQGQPVQPQPASLEWQHGASRAPPVSAQPVGIPGQHWTRASIPHRPRILSQASLSSNLMTDPQVGTSPSTYNSYNHLVAPALLPTERSVSSTTQFTVGTETDQSVNATGPFRIHVNDPTGSGSSTWPGQPGPSVNTPVRAAPHGTPQAPVATDEPEPAGPSTGKKRKGIRKGPLSRQKKDDAKKRKTNLSICARCKWKNRGVRNAPNPSKRMALYPNSWFLLQCDLGEDGKTRCTTCSTGRSNTCVCTRHHFMPLLEGGGATQFTEHHGVHALVPYRSLEGCTTSQITTDLGECVNRGWSHMSLYRTRMQAQSECTFDLRACLELIDEASAACHLFPTLRDFMAQSGFRATSRARLAACIPTLDDDPFDWGSLIDDEEDSSGGSFQFQLLGDGRRIDADTRLNGLGAVLFHMFGRLIEHQIYFALSENLKQGRKTDATITGLRCLHRRLYTMRLAIRKCSRSAPGDRNAFHRKHLRDLCLSLANIYFNKREWARKWTDWTQPVPPPLFQGNLTERSFDEWLTS
ncbi:hypothetical protein JDV02_010771 [Purpureocillium takamizusanense]|uniref:Uncharacterized protein n=1 Tax=Purpureocillium takamizusanense TaxID=2060973 RepID=A0A9Q8QSN7_9HYPO|nr:uncharacterized protein JDV02_010771 [Purpureocillium takamizusanense]UNI25065.1 hypothetical protein JDV02_010771 [Purpureocillium takamizusanense]